GPLSEGIHVPTEIAWRDQSTGNGSERGTGHGNVWLTLSPVNSGVYWPRRARGPLSQSRRVTSALNRLASCWVVGPGFPVPIARPSSFVTATISAAVPVRNISSALYRS